MSPIRPGTKISAQELIAITARPADEVIGSFNVWRSPVHGMLIEPAGNYPHRPIKKIAPEAISIAATHSDEIVTLLYGKELQYRVTAETTVNDIWAANYYRMVPAADRYAQPKPLWTRALDQLARLIP